MSGHEDITTLHYSSFGSFMPRQLVVATKKNLKQAVETPPSDARANVIFADTLTLLFEGIARTIEIHQPLIETYYGPGRLLTVLSMLQVREETLKIYQQRSDFIESTRENVTNRPRELFKSSSKRRVSRIRRFGSKKPCMATPNKVRRSLQKRLTTS